MRRSLILHPDSRCNAVTRIEVDVVRSERASLVLEFRVEGTIADIRLPAPSAATRTDDLWQHTCFEAFLRGDAGEGYFEFNFAPSTEWAAYRFDGYRSGLTVASGTTAPAIEVQADASNLNVRVTLVLDGLRDIAVEPLRLALSAVIEEVNGRKSYWALAHPPGKPDFHHRDCFALELPRI
jgi:hypothetical protein